MARRTVLTSRQRPALFCVPEREADRLCHYTLRDAGLENINARRRPRNKLVFARQLCVLRYPGRQPGLDGDDLARYATRTAARHNHLAEMHRLC